MPNEHSYAPPSTDRVSISCDGDSNPIIGNYLFYRINVPVEQRTRLQQQYRWTMWHPSLWDPWPREVKEFGKRAKFLFRAMLHSLGLFAGDDCGAILILEGHRLAHYSQFSPRYWRFPGMQGDDLQIGDTWTDPAHRGRGLASFALEKVVAAHYRPGRNFWYVVGSANAPSIRVVEKAGFTLIGAGSWVRPFGITLFGSFVMDKVKPPPASVHP